jgi:hypothetical protein
MTRRAFATAAALALLAGAGLANAQDRTARGKGDLEVKDVGAMTLQVDDLVIRVTDDTRIYDGDKKRIKFESIPDPLKVPTTVEYTGTRAGKDQIVARSVRVWETPQ